MTRDAGIVERTAAVIPAYNAAHHLDAVINGVANYIDRSRIIVVDDGSSDDSFRVASERGVVAVSHGENRGKGAALATGILRAGEAGCVYAITLDADEQHRPDEIPAFIERWVESGADLIVGNRLHDTAGMPWLRMWTNHFTSAVVSMLAGARIPDSQNGFRMISTELFRSLDVRSVRYEAESEILIKAGRAGANITSVPITTIYGDEVSAINPFVDSYRFFRMVAKSFFW